MAELVARGASRQILLSVLEAFLSVSELEVRLQDVKPAYGECDVDEEYSFRVDNARGRIDLILLDLDYLFLRLRRLLGLVGLFVCLLGEYGRPGTVDLHLGLLNHLVQAVFNRLYFLL